VNDRSGTSSSASVTKRTSPQAALAPAWDSGNARHFRWSTSTMRFCGDTPEPILRSIKRWPTFCGEENLL
jgi:hypothetical protein